MNPEAVSVGNISLESYLIFLFIFVLTVLAGSFVYAVARAMLERKWSQRNAKFLARIIQYGVFATGLYWGIYKVLKLDFTAVATSMGIITVAVAFSSQQLVQNIIAGVIISVKRPIWYDDWVEIGNSGVARVKDIVLTQTILRGIDGRIYYLPNSMLLSSSITNYTRSGFIEVPVSIAIGYNKDRKIEDIQKLILDVLNGCPKILPNVSKAEKPFVKQVFQMPHIMNMFKTGSTRETLTPRVYVTDFAFPRITLSVRFWIREIQQKNQIISDFLNSLVNRLKEEGVETL